MSVRRLCHDQVGSVREPGEQEQTKQEELRKRSREEQGDTNERGYSQKTRRHQGESAAELQSRECEHIRHSHSE